MKSAFVWLLLSVQGLPYCDAALKGIFKKFKDHVSNKEYTREELKLGIAGFYDRSSKLWEDVWGEHMHHGYYVPENRTDHKQAQIDLIDEVLKWADVNQASNIVDVGCGIGGSSRHLAVKFGAKAQGITLSSYQAERGNQLAKEQGLDAKCHFQVADALHMPFPDNHFDLVWSLESGEHMPDKRNFVEELFRVAKPGAKVILVTWVHRDLKDGETHLTKREEKLLAKVNRAYYLPKWCSTQDYVAIMKQLGAVNIQTDDWSWVIAPFWGAVIRSSLSVKSMIGLMKSGWSTLRGAYAMFLMLKGYRMGVIKFGVMTFTKPKENREKIEAVPVQEEEAIPQTQPLEVDTQGVPQEIPQDRDVPVPGYEKQEEEQAHSEL